MKNTDGVRALRARRELVVIKMQSDRKYMVP